MGDTDALIDEARGYVHPDSAHALYLIGALADALEVEAATLSSLRSRVEALADDEDLADDLYRTSLSTLTPLQPDSARYLLRDLLARLRRSLSDNKEQQ